MFPESTHNPYHEICLQMFTSCVSHTNNQTTTTCRVYLSTFNATNSPDVVLCLYSYTGCTHGNFCFTCITCAHVVVRAQSWCIVYAPVVPTAKLDWLVTYCRRKHLFLPYPPPSPSTWQLFEFAIFTNVKAKWAYIVMFLYTVQPAFLL